MSEQTSSARARPEVIKAVPVRHPGRWVTIAVLAVLVAMFVHLLVTNDRFQWRFIFLEYAEGKRGVMFTGPVLQGLQGTLILTVTSMAIGVVLGAIIAIMRLSPNRILSTVAWVYTWFFRAVPRLVLALGELADAGGVVETIEGCVPPAVSGLGCELQQSLLVTLREQIGDERF